jgi:TRAP-type transport system periplasmic protein
MKIVRASALMLALAFTAASASALTIKLGSLVPNNSPWDAALKRIAVEWGRISGGSVTVRTYAGGVAGDEPDMVRKMRIGQLGAAMVTMSGLQAIYNGVKALSYPLFIADDAELSHVLQKMAPAFEAELEKRGFKVILWSPGGWLYFFTRQPVTRPDDLRKQKLWVWGNPDEVQAWQKSGFQVVPLASTDIMTSLQSGMIDGLITSPLLAASNQWFGIAGNMTGLKLSPLWGALVVSARTWAEIPADLQPRLMESARKITADLAPQISRADAEAVAVMKKYGLKVNEVNAEARGEWQVVVETGFKMLVGTAFDPQAFKAAREYLEEYRSKQASSR